TRSLMSRSCATAWRSFIKASYASPAPPDNCGPPTAPVLWSRRFSPASIARWQQRSDMAEYNTSSRPSSTSSTDNAATKRPALLIVDDDPLITDTLDFVLGRDFTV